MAVIMIKIIARDFKSIRRRFKPSFREGNMKKFMINIPRKNWEKNVSSFANSKYLYEEKDKFGSILPKVTLS